MTATVRDQSADKFTTANKRSAFICLIETSDGVKNIDGIAALDGVDCLWVGHFDLSVSLGIPGDFANPTFTGGDGQDRCGRQEAQQVTRTPSTQRPAGARVLCAGLRFHLLFG